MRPLPRNDAGWASLEARHPLEEVQPHAALSEPGQLRHRQHYLRLYPFAALLAAPGITAFRARVGGI